jgi:hypothetical protein
MVVVEGLDDGEPAPKPGDQVGRVYRVRCVTGVGARCGGAGHRGFQQYDR